LADPASLRLGSETFGVEAMGLYDFSSQTAEQAWKRISQKFGNGIWQDVDFSWDRQGAAMASGWWEEQAEAFARARGKSTSEAEKRRNEVRSAINGFFGDERPGVDIRDYVQAIEVSLDRFMQEVDPAGGKSSDKNRMLFEDCAVTIVKNMIARIEHETRVKSLSGDPEDKIAKTLEFRETLSLLRFKDVSGGKNLLPPRLSLPNSDLAPQANRAGPSSYFSRMMHLTVDRDQRDGSELDTSFQAKDKDGKDIKVTRQMLGGNAEFASQFFDQLVTGLAANRTMALDQLGQALRNISGMDKYIRSDDRSTTDRENMAVQKAIYLGSLADARNGGAGKRTGRGECFDGSNPKELMGLATDGMKELVRRGPVDPRPFHH
jgi:hypothetical protein